MPVALDRPGVSALGDLLRSARERRGLTVQDIAAVTRIPHRHLDALEHGLLDSVPGGMYRRAEVRAYADAVGLDRNIALAQLEQALGSVETRSPVEPPAARWSASGARSALTGLAVVAILAAGTTALWLWSPTGGTSAQPAAATLPPTPAPPPAVAVTSSPVTPVPAASSSAPVAAPATAGTPLASTVDATLSVTSAPAGARVLVNGIARGQTPLTIRHLAPGTTRVRLVLDGYISDERTVPVGDGGPAALNVTLRPID
jgi:cytoskeletal protein RodZ